MAAVATNIVPSITPGPILLIREVSLVLVFIVALSLGGDGLVFFTQHEIELLFRECVLIIHVICAELSGDYDD